MLDEDHAADTESETEEASRDGRSRGVRVTRLKGSDPPRRHRGMDEAGA
jgi:hypothetical protein